MVYHFISNNFNTEIRNTFTFKRSFIIIGILTDVILTWRLNFTCPLVQSAKYG